jgi:nuclear pore complex protein Nup133
VSPCIAIWNRFFKPVISWAAILKTTDISDEVLTERYRGTALYFTLFSGTPSIPPSEALVLPSKEEILSRWPGLSAEQLESLLMDYIFEQDRLEGFQLDDVDVRIKELVESDGGNIDSDL